MLIILLRIYINVVMSCEHAYRYTCKLYLSNFLVIFLLNKCKMVKILLKNTVNIAYVIEGFINQKQLHEIILPQNP